MVSKICEGSLINLKMVLEFFPIIFGNYLGLVWQKHKKKKINIVGKTTCLPTSLNFFLRVEFRKHILKTWTITKKAILEIESSGKAQPPRKREEIKKKKRNDFLWQIEPPTSVCVTYKKGKQKIIIGNQLSFHYRHRPSYRKLVETIQT